MKALPTELYFRKCGVRRYVFDNNIPLSSMLPHSITNIGVMSNITELKGNFINCEYDNKTIKFSNMNNEYSESSYFVGNMNPFAAYDISIASSQSKAEVAIDFSDISFKNRMVTRWNADTGNIMVEVWKDRVRQTSKLMGNIACECPFKLRVHFMGVGFAIYYEKNKKTSFVGFFDCGRYFDLRSKSLQSEFKFNVVVGLLLGAEISLGGASAYLTCGTGQSDIRPITYKDGTPLIQDNKLWLLISCRGYELPHPYQGCYSLNPTTFEMKLESIIVFDRGDGLLRNEIGSQIIYDEERDEWYGYTCGFSDAYPKGEEATGIWAIKSKLDPRKGYAIMESFPLETKAHSEDPCAVYDESVNKWRMVVARFVDGKGIRAVMTESDEWNKSFTDISEHVAHDSTGTQIVKVCGTYYIFSGGSDKILRIYSYPELEYIGELKTDIPPWSKHSKANKEVVGRTWPNIIPLPKGYGKPFIAVMMDRENFPGITDHTWTYGALHFYAADEIDID